MDVGHRRRRRRAPWRRDRSLPTARPGRSDRPRTPVVLSNRTARRPARGSRACTPIPQSFEASATGVVTRATAPEYNAPHHRGAPRPERVQPRTHVQPFTGRRATIAGDDDSARPPADPRPAPSTVHRPARPGQGQAAVAGSDPARQPSRRSSAAAACRSSSGSPSSSAIVVLGAPSCTSASAGSGWSPAASARRSAASSTDVTSTPSPTRDGSSCVGRLAVARRSRPSRTPASATVDLVVTVPAALDGSTEPPDPGLPDAPRPAPDRDPRSWPSPTRRRRSSRSS